MTEELSFNKVLELNAITESILLSNKLLNRIESNDKSAPYEIIQSKEILRALDFSDFIELNKKIVEIFENKIEANKIKLNELMANENVK